MGKRVVEEYYEYASGSIGDLIASLQRIPKDAYITSIEINQDNSYFSLGTVASQIIIEAEREVSND